MRVALLLALGCTPTPYQPPAAETGPGTLDTDTDTTGPGTEPTKPTTEPATSTDTAPPTDTGTAPCPLGSPCAPIPIDTLPFFAAGDTSSSEVRHIDTYACATSDEAGAEVWYQLEVAEPGLLIASVDEVAGDGIDVDIHLLSDTTPDSCLARDDATVEAWVEPSTVFVVVDTWRDTAGVEYPGPFELTVDQLVSSPGDCPADMVDIDIACIDRYEAHLVGADPFAVPTAGVAATAAGEVPQGYISGEVAQAACQAAGKRLCTTDEWLRACEGPSGHVYPYGDTYVAGACNEGRATHPVIEVFGSGASWSSAELNDPRLNQLPDSLAPSGDYAACVTDEGIYDLHGNLHEWVADASGTFRGGFYVDASINGTGCSYATTAHSFDYHDYSTGFRCCAEIGAGR